MSTMRKLMAAMLLGCASLRAQSGSTSASDADSKTQTTESQAASDPSKRPPPDQDPGATPSDSTKLEPIKIVKAAYPLEAREKQLQGQVWVKILVTETGDVGNVELISGDPVLAKSAVDAAKKWKFKPFIKGGKPAPVSAKLPFNFAFSENILKEDVPPADASATPGAPSSGDEIPKRVRVSQGVSQGLLVYKVQPVYPPEARRERIQGTVILRAMISKEGRIADLRLISGPKELAPAAIGAVQQWRYRPYLLLGNPVAVDTEIQVNFQLR